MKKLFIKVLSLILCAVTVFGLTACGNGGSGGGSGSYTYKRTGAEFLAEAATCTTPAKYYYSNKDREKGTSTFEMGPAIHDYNDHKCSKCGDVEVYTQGLAFTTHKDGYAILAGIGDATSVDIIVPQKDEQNRPVQAIAQDAFKGNADILSVKIPEGVTKIFGSAFANCSKLVTVNFPASLDMIYANAFGGCAKLDKAYFANPNYWYSYKVTINPKNHDIDSTYTKDNADENAKKLRTDTDDNWYHIGK